MSPTHSQQNEMSGELNDAGPLWVCIQEDVEFQKNSFGLN